MVLACCSVRRMGRFGAVSEIPEATVDFDPDQASDRFIKSLMLPFMLVAFPLTS